MSVSVIFIAYQAEPAWHSDWLPANSESKVLGVTPPELRRHTSVKFLVSYADPAEGHLGTVYQATNWLYAALSQASPRHDLATAGFGMFEPYPTFSGPGP